MQQENLFTVGVIVNTHGLKGDVRVLSRTDFPEKRFAPGSVLILTEALGQVRQTVEVEASSTHKQLYIVHFKEFETIEQVEKLKGFELKIHESDLEKLPEGTYYFHQLVGTSVVDEAGNLLGIIKEVLQPGANDVYVVSRPQEKDILLPAIPDVVLNMDIEQKKMIVHLLEGLLDE